MLSVTDAIAIPADELELAFARSSGPGGQHVNKTSTRAVLRWDPGRSPSLPPDVRQRFVARYRSRLTVEGVLVLSGDRFRSQARNVADVLERLRQMILAVAEPPRPRKATRPGRGARQRRLADKRLRGAKKQLRGRVAAED